MDSESLPSEVVSGAVLRVFKFPAYGLVGGATRSESAHSTIVRLEVFRLKQDIISDWLVVFRYVIK